MRTFFPMSDGSYGEWEMTPLNILAMIIVTPISMFIGAYIFFVPILGVSNEDFFELCSILCRSEANVENTAPPRRNAGMENPPVRDGTNASNCRRAEPNTRCSWLPIGLFASRRR